MLNDLFCFVNVVVARVRRFDTVKTSRRVRGGTSYAILTGSNLAPLAGGPSGGVETTGLRVAEINAV